MQFLIDVTIRFLLALSNSKSYSFCTMHIYYTYFVVMSPSCNFPAQAEPSYEDSEPSRAELGHFNFRAETELGFFDIYMRSCNSKLFGTQKKPCLWKSVLLEEFL